jgi:hypothetical protein
MKSSLSMAMWLALALVGCSDPLDPGPTPVGPVVVSIGGERAPDAENESEPSAGDVQASDEGNRLPPPPTATLRAPADDRVEEVDSETGLPRPR